MALVKLTKLIGGRTFEFFRCTAVEGIDLQLSLLKVVGKVDTTPLFAIAKGDVGAALALGLSEVVANVAKNLTTAELQRLMEMVLKYASIDGRSFKDLNEAFADRPLDLWLAFIAAVEHNLGPLFDELRRKSAGATTQKATA